jgi:hypothetical protein
MKKLVYEMKGISSPGKLDTKNCEKISGIETKISAHRTEYMFTIFCPSY